MTEAAVPSDIPAPNPDAASMSAEDRLDLLLALGQHFLYWAGLALLTLLIVFSLRAEAYVYELYERRNMMLPSAWLAFAKFAYFTFPGLAALLGCFYLRLRRMANWRETGRRPRPGVPVKLYLALAVAAAATLALPIITEQVLLARPALLGQARLRLPAEGAYLFAPGVGGQNALHDYSIAEIGYRYRPGYDGSGTTCGDTIDEKGVARHLSGRLPYRHFRLRTDARGFVGFADRPAERADVLVVGDSFTHDAVPARTTFPYRLGSLLGRPVYNMGVGGIGPQQEFRFVRRFGPELQPKTVIWTVFEGNDIHDADSFSGFEPYADSGVPMDQYRRKVGAGFSRRYQCSAFLAFVRFAASGFPGGWEAPPALPNVDPDETPAAAEASPASHWSADPFDDGDPGLRLLPPGQAANPQPHYDRTVLLANERWDDVPLVRAPNESVLNPVRMEIAGRQMEMSFYYTVNHRSADDWRREDGFAPMVRTIGAFGRMCRERGIRLVLAYAPTKMHVYWDWVAPSATEQQLASAARLPAGGAKAKFAANRGALRDLIAAAASDEGVEFLDLTPALRAEAAKGRYVYLPHDTHWSPLGHEVVARAIAERLNSAK